MSTQGITPGSMLEKILNSMKGMQEQAQTLTEQPQSGKGSQSKSFQDMLSEGIDAVNDKQKVADRMAMEVSTGRTENLHEAMLAATQAELSFNLMVQLRNKALEAYNEIMRMPV